MRDREEREVGLRRPTSCVDDFPDPTVKGEPGTDPHDGPEAEVGEFRRPTGHHAGDKEAEGQGNVRHVAPMSEIRWRDRFRRPSSRIPAT